MFQLSVETSLISKISSPTAVGEKAHKPFISCITLNSHFVYVAFGLLVRTLATVPIDGIKIYNTQ